MAQFSQFTVDELADQAGVRDLDKECTNVDFLHLHQFCDPWELIGLHLRLTQSQISALDGDYKTTDQKRLGVLQKWKEIFAHKATYRVLIAALLACGKAEQALEMCKILAKEQGHTDKSYKKSEKTSRSKLQEDKTKLKDRQWKGVQCSLTVVASATIVLLIAYTYSSVYQAETETINEWSPLKAPRPSSSSSHWSPIPQIKPTPIATDETSLIEDDIFTPHKSGRQIVELCIKKLKSPKFNMPDDNDFLKRVAYVMSEFGENVKNNGGIWQVTPTAFEDTMDTRAHKRLPRKYQQIWNAYNIDWKSVKYKDLDKPFYSALAARLYLSNYPEYIPPAHQLQDQAEYWKFKYTAGSGNIQHFIEKVHELEHLL